MTKYKPVVAYECAMIAAAVVRSGRASKDMVDAACRVLVAVAPKMVRRRDDRPKGFRRVTVDVALEGLKGLGWRNAVIDWAIDTYEKVSVSKVRGANCRVLRRPAVPGQVRQTYVVEGCPAPVFNAEPHVSCGLRCLQGTTSQLWKHATVCVLAGRLSSTSCRCHHFLA